MIATLSNMRTPNATTMVATTALKIPGYARSARNAWTSMGGFKI